MGDVTLTLRGRRGRSGNGGHDYYRYEVADGVHLTISTSGRIRLRVLPPHEWHPHNNQDRPDMFEWDFPLAQGTQVHLSDDEPTFSV